MSGGTGGGGGPWVEIEQPKPPPVTDRYAYWADPPPALSPRCTYWVRQVTRGWMPNKYLRREGYDSSAHWYGVWIWEYLHVLAPLIEGRRGRLEEAQVLYALKARRR